MNTTQNILQIAPTFLTGARHLHDILVGVTFVCAFAGLSIISFHALQERHTTRLWPMFVRMAVAVAMLTSLPAWGDIFNDAMADLVAQAGWGKFPGSLVTDYAAAVRAKWGTESMTKTQNGTATAPAGTVQTTTGGVKITHYGYEQFGQPNYDTKSSQGIGAFGFDDTPGSLQNINASGLTAAALSPDVVQQYGLKPGQQFTVQAGGQNLNLEYADNTDPSLTGRIDLYDPTNTIGALDGAAVSTIAGGSVIDGPTTPGGFNILQPSTWWAPVVEAFTFLISVIAIICMMIMTVFQQLLYMIEIAISPIFIGLWLIPALSNLATRFFTTLAAILMWPIGWVVSDLVSKFLLDWAVNSSGNTTVAGMNALGTVFSGGSLAVGFYILLALWVIGSSFIAPIIITTAIMTNGSGIARVLAGTLGVTALTAYSTARNAGLNAATHAMTSAALSPMSTSMTPRTSYAKRPMMPQPPPTTT